MTLLDVQMLMASAIFAPLTSSDRIDPGVDADYIKPNRGMTSAERLEIYSRSYWFRILDSLYEDFPGLRAVIGERAFRQLSRAYLADCPSHSFTLRDLGSRLPEWLDRNRRYAGKPQALAIDMARLEWAHIEAFDSVAEKALEPEDLLELGPDFCARLQPYIRLLDLTYPVDDLRIRVNAGDDERGATSNAALKQKRGGAPGRAIRLLPERIFIAVHRQDDVVYYRRLAHEEYLLLDAIRLETPIGPAIEGAFKRSSISEGAQQKLLEEWFANWARLGWLCPINSSERNDPL
jgi:putative DNA-binding protein